MKNQGGRPRISDDTPLYPKTFHITLEQLHWLESKSEERRISQSAIVREMINDFKDDKIDEKAG